LGRLGCTTAPVSSWLLQSRPVRWFQHKLLGIDRRRMPPAFARPTLLERFSDLQTKAGQRSHDLAQVGPADSQRSQPVLLVPDTFTNFFEPEVGTAAIALLKSAGCSPNLGPPNLRCCGRPMISNGMLDLAVANACHNVRQLHEWALQSRPIIACEPSCILTIRDDYPALLKGDLRSKAETVAGACFTFEEFLLSRLESDTGSRPRWNSAARRILVQPHCHQRSLVGVTPTLKLLQLIPGAEVTVLDAGCCGMAGSFGYETEHYEISRLVGEQRLFPALRQAGADVAVVAPGFSCRLQVRHFTGREAVHPASLLKSFLD
jgi:Fe-S oxidoreductase